MNLKYIFQITNNIEYKSGENKIAKRIDHCSNIPVATPATSLHNTHFPQKQFNRSLTRQSVVCSMNGNIALFCIWNVTLQLMSSFSVQIILSFLWGHKLPNIKNKKALRFSQKKYYVEENERRYQIKCITVSRAVCFLCGRLNIKNTLLNLRLKHVP